MKKYIIAISLVGTLLLSSVSYVSAESNYTITAYKFQDGTIFYSLVDVIGKQGTGASVDPQTKEYITQFPGVTIKIPAMPTNQVMINDTSFTLKAPIFTVTSNQGKSFIFAPKEMFEKANIALPEDNTLDISSGKTADSQATNNSNNVDSISGTADNPVILVNGVQIQTDVPPINQDGRTLVPLRAIFEALQGQVNWDGDTGKIEGKLGDREVVMYLNSPLASVNGQAETLDVPATSINGRTMVPLRFIGESLGAKVDWDQQNYRVNIIR